MKVSLPIGRRVQAADHQRRQELGHVEAMVREERRQDAAKLRHSDGSQWIGRGAESTRLAQREIAEGRLSVSLPDSGIRETLHSLAYPLIHADRPIIRAFEEWLVGELQI